MFAQTADNVAITLADNCAMDDELARIEAALLAAIAEAKVVLHDLGVGAQFSEIVRHAREMHDVLLETLVAIEPSVTERSRGLTESFGNAIDEFELVDLLAARRLQ
jgi:hypothetical protein